MSQKVMKFIDSGLVSWNAKSAVVVIGEKVQVQLFKSKRLLAVAQLHSNAGSD